MTPEELRALADEATPGPWRYVPDSDEYIVFAPQEAPGHAAGHGETPANTRLMALAPDLARMCAELGEALRGISKGMDSAFTSRPRVEAAEVQAARAALAKLAELEARL